MYNFIGILQVVMNVNNFLTLFVLPNLHKSIFQAEVYAELGEIIEGKKPAPVDKISIFDSVGK